MPETYHCLRINVKKGVFLQQVRYTHIYLTVPKTFKRFLLFFKASKMIIARKLVKI